MKLTSRDVDMQPNATNSGCGLETDQRGCTALGMQGYLQTKNRHPSKANRPPPPHTSTDWPPVQTNSMNPSKSNPHVHSTCQPPNKLPASGRPAHRRRHFHWPGLSPIFQCIPWKLQARLWGSGYRFLRHFQRHDLATKRGTRAGFLEKHHQVPLGEYSTSFPASRIVKIAQGPFGDFEKRNRGPSSSTPPNSRSPAAAGLPGIRNGTERSSAIPELLRRKTREFTTRGSGS